MLIGIMTVVLSSIIIGYSWASTSLPFSLQWGSYGLQTTGQFAFPQGIAVDPNGDVYVVDTGNSRIQKFDSNGKFILSFGQSGLGGGQFLSPRAIVADSQGNIYVSDSGNNRIEKFTQDGVFLQAYGSSSGSNLKTPLGLSVDKSGNIYVVDNGNNRIVRLDRNGNAITSWGTQGKGPDFFDNPRDVAVDSIGNVFVVDSNNNRIQKFGLESQQIQSQITNQTRTTLQQQTANPVQQNNVPIITNPNDKTPPSITAPADMTAEATGLLTSVSEGQATATDDSGIASITNNAPQKFPLGTTVVTWTATDNGGNVAKAVQKITVADTTAPVLTAPQPVTVEAKSPDHNVVDLGLPSVNDAVGVESVTNDAPAYFPLGQTTVTWTARDASGNTATAKQMVTVQDTTAPVIHAPSDITQEATSATSNVVPLGNATVTDNGIIKSVTNNAPAYFLLGKTTVAWTATDGAGNTASAKQIVNIIDTTPSQITPPKDVVFEASSTTDNVVPLGNATVTDNGIIKSVTNNAPADFLLGKTLVLWTATDGAGNKANATQTVDVVDTTAPKLTPPKDIKAEATSLTDNAIDLGNATATDIEPVTITSNATKTFPLGKNLVLWTATDGAGNKANTTQIVDVVDTTAPKIMHPSTVAVEATSLNNNTITLNTPTITDIEQVTVTNNAQKTFPLGMTNVVWIAVDTSGNVANATQIVDVVDTTPPKLTPPKDIKAEATSLTDNAIDLGNATATDIEPVTITSNATKTFPLGKNLVLWTATDGAGNKANATQIVDVVDTTAPKIVPPQNIVSEATSMNNNTVQLGVPTVTDLQHVTVTNNAPKTFPLGMTTVLWTTVDVSGNTANATQTVTVKDTTAPKLTPPKDITIEATSANANVVDIGKANATDTVDAVSITNNATTAFPIGKTVIAWTAKDTSGNTANTTQIVDVVDTTPPKLTQPKDIKAEATSLTDNAIDLGNATATDIEPVTITSNATKTFPLGKNLVLWTATDGAGNKANATQIVDVVDTTAPKVTPPNNIVVNATSAISNHIDIGNVTTWDAVKVASVSNNTPSVFPFGNTTVMWTAKDEAGNTASAIQLIQVVDRTPPNLMIPTDIVINATAFETPVTLGQATATGIIDPLPKITNNATSQFHIGKTIVEWTALDKFGNTKTLTQTINVLACGKSLSDFNLVMGTSGNDILTGSTVPNLIIGLGGNDIIHAGPAGDCIISGDGDNIIFGGTGNDIIVAGNGKNIIEGGSVNTKIYVGSGPNIIEGGSGHDLCYLGDPSKDTIVNCQSTLR